MTVKFLLFRGNWANEGKFYALESEKTILLLATGQDYSSTDLTEQQLGWDYLKENRSKLRAIIINNTTFRNIGLLMKICQDFGKEIPLYASVPSKLILYYLFPLIKNRINVLTATSPEVEIGDFTCSFFPLNSYLVGNCAVALHHSQYSFYLIEDLLLSNCWDSELLFTPNFLTNFSAFLSSKRKISYLITSFSNIQWHTNNSLFLAPNNFSSLPDKQKFWILYEFDWLHILELLAIAYQRHQKVRIMNERFLLLIRQMLAKSHLGRAIGKEGEIILLVVDYTNIETKLNHCLAEFSPAKKSNFHFLVAIPPVVGGEERLAQIIDYLHAQSEGTTNLSKSEYFNFATSLADWKLLLQLLQPQSIILLQNSYKNAKYLAYLPSKIVRLTNQHFCQFPTEKISRLKTKKSLATLEEILIRQRKNLREEGLLIVFLLTSWQEEKLELKQIKLELLGISSVINIPKLENKIRNWWVKQLTYGLNKDDSAKITKETIKRRLNERVKTHLSKEHEIELEELPILLFFK